MHGLWGEDEQKSPDFQALRASVLGGMLIRSNELIDRMPPADCPSCVVNSGDFYVHGIEGSSCMDFGVRMNRSPQISKH